MQEIDYRLPDMDLLSVPPESAGVPAAEIIRKRDIIAQTLREFDIAGEITNHMAGPRVTRFELTLAPGVRVKKVMQIEDNLTMALAATVRILAPIPGRQTVGVEVVNAVPEAVFLREVLESEAWRDTKAEIPIALGRDIAGKPVVLDLAKAPHILISGATGTGKSVCINSLVANLLLKFRPDELKLIMIDPKVVEFEDYRKLPHLPTPIINDSAKVPIALRRAADEVDKRYRILARAGVRKLSEFNSRPDTGEEVLDDDGNPIPRKLPVLIVIIDELADMMLTEAQKDVENSIVRIAQRGRAAGIHIVAATSRPSPDIITNVIKANLPTRICFQVRSRGDSRIVLDTGGAEQLLGMGDMLYMPGGSMGIERVQGAFVKYADLRRLVDFVCRQAEPEFPPELQKAIEEYSPEEDKPLPRQAEFLVAASKFIREDDDDAIRRAIAVVLLERKASVSYLQRRLKIGYNRAAEILGELEKRKLVSSVREDGKREILADFSQE